MFKILTLENVRTSDLVLLRNSATEDSLVRREVEPPEAIFRRVAKGLYVTPLGAASARWLGESRRRPGARRPRTGTTEGSPFAPGTHRYGCVGELGRRDDRPFREPLRRTRTSRRAVGTPGGADRLGVPAAGSQPKGRRLVARGGQVRLDAATLASRSCPTQQLKNLAAIRTGASRPTPQRAGPRDLPALDWGALGTTVRTRSCRHAPPSLQPR